MLNFLNSLAHASSDDEEQHKTCRHDGQPGYSQVIITKLCDTRDRPAKQIGPDEWNHSLDNQIQREGR